VNPAEKQGEERKAARADATGPSAARDAALIDRILAGERELFHELIRPYERGLYMAAYSVLLSPEDAEDAVQDAVIKAYQGLKNFRGESRLRTWLTVIVLNEARSRWRKARGAPLEPLEQNEPESGDYTPSVLADWRYIPSRELERQELRQLLQKAMAKLSPQHREVLILRDVRGLSVAETAAATGASEGLVKVRLFRARLSMQKLLGPELGSWKAGEGKGGWMAWLSRKAGGR
jgi:RNA polymerase sigma-70 factor (ECF subfamily)